MQWINFTDKKIILLFMVNVYSLPYNEVFTKYSPHVFTNTQILNLTSISIAQLDLEILNINSAPADFEFLNTNWHPQSSFYVTSGTLSFKFLTQALDCTKCSLYFSRILNLNAIILFSWNFFGPQLFEKWPFALLSEGLQKL